MCRTMHSAKLPSTSTTTATCARRSTRSARSTPSFCADARTSTEWIRPSRHSTSPRQAPFSPTWSNPFLPPAQRQLCQKEPIMMTSKITDQHLTRTACIYIRQSTPGQVRFNQESTERQYNLKNKAQSLGWSPEKIRILDRDLGTPPRMMATKSFLAHKPWGAVLDILTCFMLREPE